MDENNRSTIVGQTKNIEYGVEGGVLLEIKYNVSTGNICESDKKRKCYPIKSVT
jgi:hypothetical protein